MNDWTRVEDEAMETAKLYNESIGDRHKIIKPFWLMLADWLEDSGSFPKVARWLHDGNHFLMTSIFGTYLLESDCITNSSFPQTVPDSVFRKVWRMYCDGVEGPPRNWFIYLTGLKRAVYILEEALPD